MDLDLYMVSTSPVQNLPNVLYENQGDGRFLLLPNGGGAAGTIDGRGDAVAMADYDADGYLDLFVTNGKSRSPFQIDGPVQLFHNMGGGNHWIELDLEGVRSNRDGIGARIEVTAGGVTQLREQAAGIHARAQNHMRVHFGLGTNTSIDNVTVNWPSGINQEIANIVADQVVEIIEPVEPDVFGQPDMAGDQSGVFIWKDSQTGSYHLRIKADSRSIFDVKLVTTEPLLTIEPIKLEGKDNLQSTEYGFSLRAVVGTQEDGVDFSLSPGARAIISVERDGVANPRQLHVGALGAPLSPAGWIKPFRELPIKPKFVLGEDLGLFVGQGLGSGVLKARMSGNGPKRSAGITLVASHSLLGFTPISLEVNDIVTQTASSVAVEAKLGPWTDGIDLSLSVNSNVGIVYRQDNMMAPSKVNQNAGKLGLPNAYWLPVSGP
jgi:hypothetical protein